MILFLLAAAAMLVYGAAYGFFCMQKGGVAAALSIFAVALLDLGLLCLLVYFRIHT